MVAIEPFSVTVGADGDTVGSWDPERSIDTIGDVAARADDEEPSPSRGLWSTDHEGQGSDLPLGYWPRVEVLGHDAATTRDQRPSPSLNHEGQRADSTPLAQAADGAGGGTSSGTFSLTTETVTSPGSGLVFVNNYGSAVTDAFHSCIIAAEHFFQSNFTNACTLDVSFDLKALSPSFIAYNNFSFVHVSYATLKNALATHDTTSPDQLAAVASLPTTDPSHGAGFNLPVGYADMLGLSRASGTDSVVLSSSVDWNWGQDAIGAIEHEISEGAMGRLGGLGVQNKSWSTMDLFRYTAAGVHDYTGGKDGLATYFSTDGTHIELPFHNSVSTAGTFDGYDFADWDFSVAGDAFGPAGPSSPGYISQTDLQVLNVLGWTLSNQWRSAPVSGDFNSASNWLAGFVPTGMALFGSSAVTAPYFSADTTVGGLSFSTGSPNYTFSNDYSLKFNGSELATNGCCVSIINNDDLAFANSSSAGATNITNNDVLHFFNNSTAGNAVITTTNGGETLFCDNSSAGNAQLVTEAGGIVDFSVTAGPAGAHKLTVGSIAGAGSYFLGANQLTVGSDNLSTLVSGSIQDSLLGPAGDGSLIKVGSGTLTLSGSNTYTGSTTVTSGILALSGSGSISNSNTVIDNGTFDISGTSVGASIKSLAGKGAVTLGSQSLTLTNASGTFAGAISGSGEVILAAGAEKLTIANGYTGATTINSGGTLILSGAGSVATSNCVTDNGAFDLSATTSGALISTLSGSGTVMLGRKTLTLTNASDCFSGAIQGTGKLVLAGGTEQLTCASTYSGGTLLRGGTLRLGAVGATGKGSISFAAGNETLQIENAALSNGAFSNSISSFGGAGSVIDFSDLAFAIGATAIYNSAASKVSVTSNGVTDIVALSKPVTTQFAAVSDGQGGTEIIQSPKVMWQSGVSGDFASYTYWAPAALPTAVDTVVITGPGISNPATGTHQPYTVTSAIDEIVNALMMSADATLFITNHSQFDIISGTASGANAGAINVDDGASVLIGGNFNNSGTIALDTPSGSDGAELLVSGALNLTGVGKLTLLNDHDVVHSAGSSATLTNAGNTISGVGLIGGDDLLNFVNKSGVIAANISNDSHGLVIDTLSFTNAGTLEATNQGVLVIESDINNTSTGSVKALTAGSHVDLDAATIAGGGVSTVAGSLVESVGGSSVISHAIVKNAGVLGAEGGDLMVTGGVANAGTLDANNYHLAVLGPVTGTGRATIEGSGVLEFGAASSAKVAFASGATGALILDTATNASFKFTGTITGFAPNDHIDLGAIDYTTGDQQLSYAANSSGTAGVLAVTDGTHTETLHLDGSYHQTDFHISNDGHGHVDLWM